MLPFDALESVGLQGQEVLFETESGGNREDEDSRDQSAEGKNAERTSSSLPGSIAGIAGDQGRSTVRFGLAAFGQHQHCGEDQTHRQDTKQQTRARDDPELAKSSEIGREGEEEDAGAGGGSEEVADPGGPNRLSDSLFGGRSTSGFRPASDHVNSVVETDAHQNEHEDDAQQVESTHQQRRGAVGPSKREQEGQHRE